jgi:hypothetical protein
VDGVLIMFEESNVNKKFHFVFLFRLLFMVARRFVYFGE